MTATELVGVVPDLDESVYHRHEALSSSGARLLLPPNCPAIYRHQRDNGEAPTRVFDLGRAAHQRVLGAGADVVVVQKTAKDGTHADADDYLTRSAQEHRDAIRAQGLTPLLRKEDERVNAMAAALRAHPIASALFDPDRGRPEVSVFWEDWSHGVERRARFDWLPDTDGGRLLLPDLKTTTCAEPSKFTRSVGEYGYALQAVWYCDAARAVGLADDVTFRIVAIEKTPPHLVTVVELDEAWLRIGRRRAQQALRTFADCQASGRWPGYSDGVEVLHPPVWMDDEDDPWSGP